MKTRLWKWSEVSAVTLPIMFSLLGLIGAVFQAHASTTIAVSTNSDTVANDGLCSLREAIAAANSDTAPGSSSGECPAGSGSDTITIPSIEISLGSRLIISSPIALVGVGVGSTVIKGNNQDGVFQVNAGHVTFRGLTIQGGTPAVGSGRSGIAVFAGTIEISDARITGNTITGGGGGLYVASGATVTVWRTTIDQNQGAGAGNGGAGGIANAGTLFVHESLLVGNTSNRTGGIWNGRGARLELRNTTLSGNEGNSPDAGTGGLVNQGVASLNNVTITQNKGRGNNPNSFRGGGLQSYSGATTIVKNSIIANNDGRGGPNDCAGALTSDSVYNLIRDMTGCGLPPNTATFILNQDPKLAALASNGGSTQTHALSVDSPAIDKGNDPYSCIDQRGYTRSVDGNGDGLARLDVGAYEFGAIPNPTPCPSPMPPQNVILQ